jgi:hypothetical protein
LGTSNPSNFLEVTRALSDVGHFSGAVSSKSSALTTGRRGWPNSLGVLPGVTLITQKVQQFRDAARYRAFLAQKKEMAERQQRETVAFDRKLALETLTLQRRLRALELVEQRERKSLEISLLKDRRVEERERSEGQPEPELTPTHTDEFNKAAKKPIDLTAEFERASGSAGDGGEAAGGGRQEPAPEAEITIQRRRRARDRSQESDPPTKRNRTERDPEGDKPSGDDRRRRGGVTGISIGNGEGLLRHPLNPVAPQPEMTSAFLLGLPQRRMQRDFMAVL